jgi:hypothetical protein
MPSWHRLVTGYLPSAGNSPRTRALLAPARTVTVMTAMISLMIYHFDVRARRTRTFLFSCPEKLADSHEQQQQQQQHPFTLEQPPRPFSLSPPVTLPVLKSNKSDRCATFVELVARRLFLSDLFRLFEGLFCPSDLRWRNIQFVHSRLLVRRNIHQCS